MAPPRVGSGGPGLSGCRQWLAARCAVAEASGAGAGGGRQSLGVTVRGAAAARRLRAGFSCGAAGPSPIA